MNIETLDGLFRQLFAKPTIPNDPPDMSWGELADLTHETQVGIWGFCTCEDGPKVYDDCPNKDTQ